MPVGDVLIVKTETNDEVTESGILPHSRSANNTSSLYAGYWHKILTVETPSSYSDNAIVLVIASKGPGALRHSAGLLVLRAKRQDIGAGEPTHVELTWRSLKDTGYNHAIVPDGIRLVYEGNGESCLYIRVDDAHAHFEWSVLSQAGSATYESNSTANYIATLPAGTQWVATGDWVFQDTFSVVNDIVRAGESWNTISTFYNSWAAYDVTNYPVRYRKFPDGRVRLEGLIKNGTLGVRSLTLVTGYRPGKQQFRSCVCSGWGAAVVDINPNGDLLVRATSSTSWVDLSGIEFYAEQ